MSHDFNTLACNVTLGMALFIGCAASWAEGPAGAVPAADGPTFRVHAHDPGPRPNPSSEIPNPVPGLNANEAALFIESLLRVSELEGTCDTCSQQPQNQLPVDPDPKNPFSPRSLTNSAGMGPVFNADQCFICHSQPQIGGSSPKANPAQLIAHRVGGTNVVPSFEARDGAFRETRFKFNPDGSRDGGARCRPAGKTPTAATHLRVRSESLLNLLARVS